MGFRWHHKSLAGEHFSKPANELISVQIPTSPFLSLFLLPFLLMLASLTLNWSDSFTVQFSSLLLMFLQISTNWVSRCNGMSWENVSLAKFSPVTGADIAAFLCKFSADSSDQTAPGQLWLKALKSVFRDRQDSLYWAASPIRLPCASAGEELEPSSLGKSLGALGI